MANGDAGDFYFRNSFQNRRSNRLIFEDALKSNKYERDLSYYSSNGGYYLYQKGITIMRMKLRLRKSLPIMVIKSFLNPKTISCGYQSSLGRETRKVLKS